jgi:large subunit ribosomal protein L24e
VPELRRCDFCGRVIEPGTGKMFVKNDGTILWFCSSKCERNMLKLERDPKKVRWTERYREFRAEQRGEL